MQWFIKIQPLADRAIEAVEKDYIRFAPANYRLIYLNWMRNIHDWCISRQLWWGHRIPAWHCACGEILVAREEPVRCARCGAAELKQETDVLDTWFSSALLPFTALGWPEATADLKAFYPTSLLITGFDILFFWVARMIMMGCWFMAPPEKPLPGGRDARPSPASAEGPALTGEELEGSVPFREVYIHALVRDAERQKMSKVKGNVIDPIHVVEKYGTDATRFTLAAMSAPGTDIAFNESRTEGYRAFANKIWNAARFMFMNMDRLGLGGAEVLSGQNSADGRGIHGFSPVTLEDRWILSRFNRVTESVNESLVAYRFDEAAHAIYDFFWGEFCDWYIELMKPRLAPECPDDARIGCTNLVSLFEASLRLLHPVMPFITEEIWHAMYAGKPPQRSLALAAYPAANDQQVDPAAETQMAILEDLIVNVRNLRAELKVETKAKVPIEVFTGDPGFRALLEENSGAVERLGNVDEIRFTDASLEKLAGARHTARFDVRLVYEKKIDTAAECARLKKELEKIDKNITSGHRQLGNEQFLAKAPPQVVENLRKQQEELALLQQKTLNKLTELGCS